MGLSIALKKYFKQTQTLSVLRVPLDLNKPCLHTCVPKTACLWGWPSPTNPTVPLGHFQPDMTMASKVPTWPTAIFRKYNTYGALISILYSPPYTKID